MVNKIKVSARLRATIKVSNLVGLKYDTKKNPYGGFYTVLELERIVEKIEALQTLSPTK